MKVMQENLSAGMTVAVCLVMVKVDSIIVAHVVKPVPHVREQGSSHSGCTAVVYGAFPWDAVIRQTLFQYA